MKQSLQKSLQTRDLGHFRGGGLDMCEVLYPAKLNQPRHTHKFASFSFVLCGNYTETVNSSPFPRQASTLIFHPPEESHAVVFENEVRIFSVEFSFERLLKLKQHGVVFDDSTSCCSEETNMLGNKIYREFCRMDSFSKLAIEGLILELLAEAARRKFGVQEKNIPFWLKRTKEFLHDNFTEAVTLELLAEIADVHPVYLSRIFREKFDCTIGEYVRRLRVEFASKQISTTENPLSEIALMAGFADQSHLSKTFKSSYGLTPAEFRKLRKLN